MIERKIDFPYDVLVLDDLYTDEEQQWLWNEIEYLQSNNLFMSPENTYSARNEDGSLKKKNKSVFLTEIYPEEYLQQSALIMIPRTRFLSDEVMWMMYCKNPTHGILHNVTKVSPLVSYYEDGDGYDFHWDESAYSTLSYLVKDEEAFDGGEIVFNVNEFELTLPIKNNMGIIFPSRFEHSVKEVRMRDGYEGKGLGRLCISQFLWITNIR